MLGLEAGAGGRGGQVQENDCADLQDLELKGGREGTLQHGPGAILEGAIGSCRQSGWLRRFWARKDATGHVLKL